MNTPKQINHFGVIEKIDGNIFTVSITSVSACAGCHAKGVCSMADMKEKSIEIESFDNNFKVGEKVNIVSKESLGLLAVILAYVLPFVLVLATMIIVSAFTENELFIGLIGLGILFPYFLVISFLKDRLTKTFSFTIQKIV